MTDLDSIKEHWSKKLHFPVQTKEQLQNIIRESSSATLKWLIVVNFFELLLFTVLSLVLEESEAVSNEKIINDIVSTLDFILFALPLLFSVIYLVLIREIRVKRSVFSLLRTIHTARKLLNVYIYLNIAIFLLILYLAIFLTISSEHIDDEAAALFGTTTSYVILISICIITSLVFMLSVWLFYRLLYGRLLKRLNRNYEELKDME